MGSSDQGVERSWGRYLMIPRVLCFIRHGNEVLLLRGGPQKRLWSGKYNGLGGHVEPGEDVQEAMLREVREESGLDVHDARLCYVVHVDVGDPLHGVVFFVFTATVDARTNAVSPDGDLAWFPVEALPLADLVEDLPELLPRVLAMGPGDPPSFALYQYDAWDRLVMRFPAAQKQADLV